MSKDLEARIEKLELLTRANPDGRVFLRLASAYRRTGRPDQARQVLERALARRPEDAASLVMLGCALLDLGRWADAQQALRDALSLAPEELDLGALRALAELAPLWRGTEALGGDAPPFPDEGLPLDLLERFGAAAAEPGASAGTPVPAIPRAIPRPAESPPAARHQVEAPEPAREAPLPDAGEWTDAELVTSTLAELYLSQGFHHQALALYRELLDGRPDEPGLEATVRRLERMVAAEALEERESAAHVDAPADAGGSADAGEPADAYAPAEPRMPAVTDLAVEASGLAGEDWPAEAGAPAEPTGSAEPQGLEELEGPREPEQPAEEAGTEWPDPVVWPDTPELDGAGAASPDEPASDAGSSPAAPHADAWPSGAEQPLDAERPLDAESSALDRPADPDLALGARPSDPDLALGDRPADPDPPLRERPGFRYTYVRVADREAPPASDAGHPKPAPMDPAASAAAETAVPQPQLHPPAGPHALSPGEFDWLFIPSEAPDPAPQEEPGAGLAYLVELAELFLDVREDEGRAREHAQRVRRIVAAVARERSLDGNAARLAELGALLLGLGGIGGGGEEAGRVAGEWIRATHERLDAVDLPPAVGEMLRLATVRWDRVRPTAGSRASAAAASAGVLAVAAAFVAGLSASSARDLRGARDAVDGLRREAGRRYDPEAVVALLRALERDPMLALRFHHRVLLVGPPGEAQVTLARGLRASGFWTDAARGPDSARERLSAQARTDAVLLAGAWSAEELLGFIRELRLAEGGPPAPVVLVTGIDDSRRRAALLDAGADACFPSRIRFGELRSALRALLRRAAERTRSAPGDVVHDSSVSAHRRVADQPEP